MRRISKKSRIIQISSLLLSINLTGCQIIGDVNQSHMDTLLQWNKAATQTNSILQRAKLQLTTELRFKDTEYGTEYWFDKFTVGGTDNKYTINLINPSFSEKVICSWYCELLSEVQINDYDKNTYLYQFSKAQQTNIADMYAQLSKLSLHLEKSALPVDIINARITLINDSEIIFDDFNSAYAFLTAALMEESFTPNNTTSLIPEGEQKIKSAMSLNQQVCTLKDNFFGHVIAKNQQGIAVKLIGQATGKTGLGLKTLPSGYLKHHQEGFSYIALNKVQVFKHSDVYTCTIKY